MMRKSLHKLSWISLGLAATLTAGACSHVPNSRAPQVIEDRPMEETTAQSSWKCKGEECKQIMLTLAYTADLSSGLTGDSASVTAETAGRVECFLPKASALGDDWTIEWGPVVVTKKDTTDGICEKQVKKIFPPQTGDIPANTMLVAKHKSQGTYVVAIAGTNSSSIYDWCLEDMAIKPTAWPFGGAPSTVKATEGTLTGLGILQGMKSEGKTLLEYLKTTPAGIEIYITGHSLGGALAPATALWLKNEHSEWNTSGLKDLHLYAFAGPTPGNQAFANYLNNKFPESNIVIINNTNDAVPHAFTARGLKEIPSLYSSVGISPNSTESTMIRDIQEEIKYLFHSPNYAHAGTGTQVQPITGKIIPPSRFDTANCPILHHPGVSKMGPFAEEALYQHNCAYPNQLGLPNLSKTIASCS